MATFLSNSWACLIRRKFATAVLIITFSAQSNNACNASVVVLASYINALGKQSNPIVQLDVSAQTVPIGGVLIGDSIDNYGFSAAGSAFFDIFPYLQLGAFASASFDGMWRPETQARARSQVSFADTVVLNGPSLPSSLTFHFELSGQTITSGGIPYHTPPHANIAGCLNNGLTQVCKTLGTGPVTLTFPVRGNTVHYGVRLVAQADSEIGLAVADAMHTMRLTSITLPNGNTPESEGISLTFESGVTSPNVAAVPEASSLFTWLLMSCIGLLFLPHRA